VTSAVPASTAAALADGGPAPSRHADVAGRRWLTVLVIVLVAGAALVAPVAGGLPGAPRAGLGEQAALVLLLLLAGFLSLDFRVGSSANRVDLFDAALAAALLALPGPRLLVAVVLVKACVLLAQSVARDKVLFNLAQWACAASAGALVVAAARDAGPVSAGDLRVLPLALLAVALLNGGAVLLVLTLVGREDARTGSRQRLLRGMLAGGAVNLVLGLVVAALWMAGTQARLAVPVLLLVAHVGTGLWAQQRAGRSRLAGLQRASAILAGPDELRVALPVFLEELRQAFECEGVEVRLAVGTPLRVATGRDLGPDATADLLGAVGEDGSGVRLGPAPGPSGWRDGLAAPVRFRDRVVGVLSTFDREGWDGFEHGELPVLEAAAGVLAEALHRDELAQVLRAERLAVTASEVRWRAFAHVLEVVARGDALPDTLQLLACTVEEQCSARCVVVVHAPGQDLLVASATLPVPSDLVASALLPDGRALPTGATLPVTDLAPDGAGAALRTAGLAAVRTWPLPCTPDGGARGVLALAYPCTEPAGDDAALAEGAARVGALAVDHVLVHRRLAHQADHDTLTDLPNRRAFLDRLTRALAATARTDRHVLVLFLDLDRFKVVNDSLGHRAGDELLRAVAARLRTAVRPGDTVARFGGDEFTMLCEDVQDEAHALRVVDRVRAALERPFPLEGSEHFATGSIGIALGRGPGESAETLVENADAAMYRAKDHGGNRVELFDDAMRDRAVRRLALSSALHRAVEREEFLVAYQPTVRLSTGQVEGAEALVRWQRPGHGLVAPLDFVPLAEENGLIVPIGEFVLAQACAQARRWSDEAPGAGPTVSVNLSARQLVVPDFVPAVRRALEVTGVDPGCISFEITESVLMGDVAAIGTVLTELKALGPHVFVDDFGTGYASLTYLRRFPVDGVKIDRSFVAGLGTDADDEAIVRAVIGLAHGLGLVAVAEGVETQDQLDMLVDLRCDIGQGYHLGRPAPAAQVSRDRRQ
jgi:diguanylate cyclase (GGDEF)-like protein